MTRGGGNVAEALFAAEKNIRIYEMIASGWELYMPIFHDAFFYLFIHFYGKNECVHSGSQQMATAHSI